MIKFGLAQMDIAWEDPAANMKKCATYFTSAKAEGVGVLVFPETTCTGFTNNAGPAAAAFPYVLGEMQKMSAQHGIAAVFGAIALGQAKAQNRCIALAPSGDVLWQYTKIHPFSYSGEDRYFEKGAEIAFGEIGGSTCSPFVCYDLRFPEIFQAASGRAEILIVIANWPAARIGHWDVLLKARAIENQSFVVGVNRAGEGNGVAYCGHSAAIDPMGAAMHPVSEGAGLIAVEVDPEICHTYRQGFRVKQDRNPKLYAQFYAE